jgi:hypothetical protein
MRIVVRVLAALALTACSPHDYISTISPEQGAQLTLIRLPLL